MSKNTSHPNAAKPCLSATIIAHINTCSVQIVDDIVCVVFWVHGLGIISWNWRIGEQIMVCHDHNVVRRTVPLSGGTLPRTDALPPGNYTFTFISPRVFVLTAIDGSGSVEIFTFDATPSDGQQRPLHVASLRLPALQKSQELASMTAESGPFLAHPGLPDAPLWASQNERIHVFSLEYGTEAVRDFDEGLFRSVFTELRNSFGHVQTVTSIKSAAAVHRDAIDVCVFCAVWVTTGMHIFDP